MKKKLIINADDFGKNNQVNKAIIYCLKNAICTHTTLMINMPSTMKAVKLAKKENKIKQVGLHLNLTEGMPLTENIKKYKKFCNLSGSFNAQFHKNVYSKFFLSNQEKKAVVEEIETQIELFLEITGLKEIRLDSHHHVHTNYSIFILLESLVDKYNIVYIRKSRNLFQKINFYKKVYKKIYNKKIENISKEKVDAFGSIKDILEVKNYESLRYKSFELMIHPEILNDKITDVGGVEINLENEVKKLKNILNRN